MKSLFFIVILFVFGLLVNSNAQVVVIANKSVPESVINKSKLEDIYKLSTNKWKNGDKIVVFDLKTEGKTRTAFYGFMGKSPDELKKTWMRLQLTGEGNAPKSLSSEYEIVDMVASTNGAIGYVSADKVNANVKVLLTIK